MQLVLLPVSQKPLTHFSFWLKLSKYWLICISLNEWIKNSILMLFLHIIHTFILMCRPRRVQMYLYNMLFSVNNKKINRKTYEYKKIMARLTIWKWMNYVQFYSLIIFIIIFISYIRIFIEGIRFFLYFLVVGWVRKSAI